MKKIRSYFQFMLLEIKKIIRAPLLLCFVIFAPIVIVGSLGTFFNNSYNPLEQYNKKQEIVFVRQGEGDVSKIENIFEDCFSGTEIVWVDDFNSAEQNLKLERISIIVVVNANKEPVDCTIYYNPYNTKSTYYLNEIDKLKGIYSYITVKEYLAEWGVEIDDEYFQLATNEPIEQVNVNTMTALIPSILTISMAFLIVIMSVYMFSRDNETGVSNIIAYTPIKSKDYILSKAAIIFAISVLQSFVVIAILPLFDIRYLGTYIGSVALLSLFCLSFVAVCSFISVMLKQISMASLGIVSIIIPLIIVTSVDITKINTFLKILLYLLPVSSGLQLLRYYMHYGIFVWEYFVIQMAILIVSIVGLIIFFKVKYNSSLKKQTINKKEVKIKKDGTV